MARVEQLADRGGGASELGLEAWRFADEMTKFKMELKAQGKPVTMCTALHVFKESNVKNPTGRMLLTPGHYYYVEEERDLHGQYMDVILAAQEKKK